MGVWNAPGKRWGLDHGGQAGDWKSWVARPVGGWEGGREGMVSSKGGGGVLGATLRECRGGSGG